jgi:hypothetical protein
MVEWAEEENDIGALGGKVQGACIADSTGGEWAGAGRAAALRLRDQPWRRIDEVHRIPRVGQPECVRAGGPAHVKDRGGRPPCMPLDQLSGPQRLEQGWALVESVFLGRW